MKKLVDTKGVWVLLKVQVLDSKEPPFEDAKALKTCVLESKSDS